MPGIFKDQLRCVFPALAILICMSSPALSLNIDGEQQLGYADTLFANQQYLKAAKEYQRFAFFFKDHPKNRTARFRAGEAFLLAREPAQAVRILQTLISEKQVSEEQNDALSMETFFLLAECHLQLNMPTQAVVQLNNAIVLSDDPTVEDRAYYRIGWIHIEIADWDGAKKAFNRMSTTGRRRHGLERLDKALSGAGDRPSKNPALAGTLSVIPGGGQLYCHRYEDALIAFALNAGFFWAASDAFDNEQYGLGGLLSFVGLGFYLGNIYGAVNDAHKYNHLQTRQFIDQLRQYQIRIPGPQDGAALDRGLVLGLKIPF
jgi:tetratricopeptide (TPR) repeat protein